MPKRVPETVCQRLENAWMTRLISKQIASQNEIANFVSAAETGGEELQNYYRVDFCRVLTSGVKRETQLQGTRNS